MNIRMIEGQGADREEVVRAHDGVGRRLVEEDLGGLEARAVGEVRGRHLQVGLGRSVVASVAYRY